MHNLIVSSLRQIFSGTAYRHALLSTRLLPAIVQAIALVKVMKTLQVSYFNDALCVSMRGELH